MPPLAPVTTAERTGDDWGLAGVWLMPHILVAHSTLMTPTALARVAGVLGGLCWLGRALLDGAGGSDPAVNALHWGGLALIALALLGIGAGLVSGLAPLRVLVAVCLTVLVWAILEVLHDQYSDRWSDGVFGALLAAYCATGLLARRRDPGPTTRERATGSHAA
jgi:hypothetical protein